MRVLAWHVHGSWMTSFVQGPHEHLVPVTPDRSPDGLGRARTYPWPDTVTEVTPEELRDTEIDLVVLQRPHELELCEEWTGRRPGRDLPAVYVEHNTPRDDVTGWRHPLADRDDVPVVHVTPFNAAMWDNGRAPVRVIEHGVPDPGHLYRGHEESPATLGVVVNEPVRRARVAGIDLAARISREVGVELYGLGLHGVEALFPPGRRDGLRTSGLLAAHEDVPQVRMHAALAGHRAYLHPYRWTSLGLALIEAMTLGMPVLVLAATAAPEAVPDAAGLVTADVEALARRARQLAADPDAAYAAGLAARAHALDRFGIDRFVEDWDRLMKEVAG